MIIVYSPKGILHHIYIVNCDNVVNRGNIVNWDKSMNYAQLMDYDMCGHTSHPP